MPQLDNFRKTEKIKLPSFEDSELEIYTSLLYGDTIGITGVADNAEQLVVILTKIIKSWNFTDKENETLPITVENIKKLPVEDINFLAEKITNIYSKKK